MSYRSFLVLFCAVFSSWIPSGHADLEPWMLVPDRVLYQEDFQTPKPLGKEIWHPAQGTQWTVENGVLHGRPSTPEYQASHKDHRGLEARGGFRNCPPDYIARFAVRFLGGLDPEALPSLRRIPSIDLGHHIGRVEFGLEGARLMADGETVLVAQEPKFRLEPGRWYEVIAEVRGDEVLVRMDPGLVLYGKHAAFLRGNHDLAFVGRQEGEVEVDRVTLWTLAPRYQPGWPKNRMKLPKQEDRTIRQKRPGQIAKERQEAAGKP
jgi:hypothetical protein